MNEENVALCLFQKKQTDHHTYKLLMDVANIPDDESKVYNDDLGQGKVSRKI